jgi:hypothetical protein
VVVLQKQKFRHHPEQGQIGDCHRTAIAMILGKNRDDVPHFVHDNCNTQEFRKRELEYLQSCGLAAVSMPVNGDGISPETMLECLSVWAPLAPCILGGTSRTGCNHSVVVEHGKMFDPSLNDSGIVGPCGDGYYWVTTIVKLIEEEKP